MLKKSHDQLQSFYEEIKQMDYNKKMVSNMRKNLQKEEDVHDFRVLLGEIFNRPIIKRKGSPGVNVNLLPEKVRSDHGTYKISIKNFVRPSLIPKRGLSSQKNNKDLGEFLNRNRITDSLEPIQRDATTDSSHSSALRGPPRRKQESGKFLSHSYSHSEVFPITPVSGRGIGQYNSILGSRDCSPSQFKKIMISHKKLERDSNLYGRTYSIHYKKLDAIKPAKIELNLGVKSTSTSSSKYQKMSSSESIPDTKGVDSLDVKEFESPQKKEKRRKRTSYKNGASLKDVEDLDLNYAAISNIKFDFEKETPNQPKKMLMKTALKYIRNLSNFFLPLKREEKKVVLKCKSSELRAQKVKKNTISGYPSMDFLDEIRLNHFTESLSISKPPQKKIIFMGINNEEKNNFEERIKRFENDCEKHVEKSPEPKVKKPLEPSKFSAVQQNNQIKKEKVKPPKINLCSSYNYINEEIIEEDKREQFPSRKNTSDAFSPASCGKQPSDDATKFFNHELDLISNIAMPLPRKSSMIQTLKNISNFFTSANIVGLKREDSAKLVHSIKESNEKELPYKRKRKTSEELVDKTNEDKNTPSERSIRTVKKMGSFYSNFSQASFSDDEGKESPILRLKKCRPLRPSSIEKLARQFSYSSSFSELSSRKSSFFDPSNPTTTPGTQAATIEPLTPY